MKLLLIAVFVALAGVGCGSSPGPASGNEAPQPAVNSPIPVQTAAAKGKEKIGTAELKIAAPSGKGTLKGVAKYAGTETVLPPKALPADSHAACHGKEVPDESLIVEPKTQGIQGIMVRIMNVEFKDPLPKPATLPQIDQKGCIFAPHVVIVPPGTDLEVLNPQGVSHSFKTVGVDFLNPERNVMIPASMPKYVYPGKDLSQPEIVQVTCAVHSWMKAYILVNDPRSCAVTGADGAFEIKELPAGKYKLNIWHEKLAYYKGQEFHTVEIKPGQTTDMGELKFEPKK
jgi:hypothetical protein